MNDLPFCVFKRSNRPCYFVLFKDQSGKYINKPVSTRKKTEKEAKQIAFEWYRNGIPQKETVVKISDLALQDVARNIKTENEASVFLAEMRKQGIMKSYVINNTPQAQVFTKFLLDFWVWDSSPYVKEKLRKKHGLHKTHCVKQGQAVIRFWQPFFKERYLGEITAADIDDFINHMGDMDLSASRKNVVIKAGFKALRWAFSKGMIDTDPTRGHLLFSGDKAKRQILTPMTAGAIFRTSWKNASAKLGNMLAAVTGMRSGEILALRFQDLGTDCLYVEHSWNRMDKLKLTKTNDARTVEVPFPDVMNSLIKLAKLNPWGVTPNSFIFWGQNDKDAPMSDKHFIKGLRTALTEIGYTEQEAKKYLFHGWRHFYTAYMINKVGKKLVKSQTGHKTDVMVSLYSEHETEGDRELIQAASRETFAAILPNKPKMLVFKKETFAQTACG